MKRLEARTAKERPAAWRLLSVEDHRRLPTPAQPRSASRRSGRVAHWTRILPAARGLLLVPAVEWVRAARDRPVAGCPALPRSGPNSPRRTRSCPYVSPVSPGFLESLPGPSSARDDLHPPARTRGGARLADE